jgi:hypothetical protein
MALTQSPDSMPWLPATTYHYSLAVAAFGVSLVAFLCLLATGHSLRYSVIGVLLTGGFFIVFLALFAGRSMRRMTVKAPLLAAALPAANRADTSRFLVGQAIRVLIPVIVLTLLLGNPALPGIGLGGGFWLLITTRLIRRWQEQHHETLVVARKPHNPLLPERPAYYRIPGG